jgi:hypothetical protein
LKSTNREAILNDERLEETAQSIGTSIIEAVKQTIPNKIVTIYNG